MKSIAGDLKASDLIKFIKEEGKDVNPLASLRIYFENWGYQGFLTSSLLELGRRLETENPKEVAELIERVDAFVSGSYVFQNEWDMERTNVPEYFHVSDIKWNHNPDDDPEWMYMLNRHGFLVDVAIAYDLTLNQKYLNYMEAFLSNWLVDNPLSPLTRKSSWRTIDAGLRVVNWVKLLEILTPLQALSSRLFYELLISIEQHLAFLTEELSVSRGQSNWSILEITGIIIGSLAFKEFDNSSDYLSKALAYLSPAIALQVEEDGMQREQSFMYHHEVLICLLQIILIAERNQLELDPFIREQAIKMAQASAHFIKPDGTQSNYGDSDGESMIGVLSVAEKIIKKPLLIEKMALKSPLYEKLFVGIQPTELTSERLISLPSVSFANAGLSIMRSLDNQDYTLFKCGPLGGGHGHDDLLHLEVYTQGRTVLVDSGRYSYDCDRHQRLAYKEGQAHNTIIVDGRNFNAHCDSWETTKVATPVNQKQVVKEGAQFVEGGHLGYLDLADPVLVNRKVIYLSEGIWFISDEISCQKEHLIETSFHFLEASVNKMGNQKVRYQDQLGSVEIEVLHKDGLFDSQDCDISFQYNQKQVSQRAIYKYHITGNHSLTYIMSNQSEITYRKIPVGLDDQTLLSDCEVECYALDLPNGHLKYVLIQHREPAQGRRAYYIEGNYVYGRISVVEYDSERNFVNQIKLY